MTKFFLLHPEPGTNARCVESEISPGPDWVKMTQAEFDGWLARQPPPPLAEPPPPPDWDGFRRMALGSRTIGRAMVIARANEDASMNAAGVPVGEPAVSALPAALLEAMNGDSRALAAAWGVLVMRGGLTHEDLAPIVAAAKAFNLPADFVAALSPAPG